MKEPVHVNDIRRWAQAMHHPNRLFYDDEYAAESRFGGIVAPQSFTVNCVSGHGARPATFGHIPESHMLFGGDEWWFFGPRIRPGDRLTVDFMVFDYRKTSTRFAGPTVIQRGDNHYTNDRGEKVALQRSGAVRYRPAAARETASFSGQESETEMGEDEQARILKEREAYIATIIALGHDPRSWNSVSEGDELPVKVIGPHSIISFATEWRAYTFNTWEAMDRIDFFPNADSGFTQEMSVPAENAKWDPEFADGAYYGAARGHLNDRFARRIGMPKAYGYGASMGAWIIDFLSTWAGEWGSVEHCNSQYRGPAFVGDATYFRGTVTGKSDAPDPSQGRVHIEYVMANQADSVLAKGSGEVLLPRE
jgi:acyl dehydratase